MKTVGKVLGVILLVVAALVAHRAYSNNGPQNQDNFYQQIRAVVEVLDIINRDYFEEVDMDKIVTAGLKGMMGALDPHSTYFTPKESKAFNEDMKGSFGGIGTVISVKNGSLVVVAPIEDTPADRLGIRSGDKIVAIDGKSTEGISVEDAVSKLRGGVGTRVSIEVRRLGEEKPIAFDIRRATIKIQSLHHKLLPHDIGYIRLSAFRDGVSTDIVKALELLRNSTKNGTLAGLVLDLRNNPGGLITEGSEVADMFVKEGVIVYTEGRTPRSKLVYRAKDDSSEPEFPVVVLVNEGSASASEIVAGALQDHRRALIVGARTFGKGSVQGKFELSNGASVKITTALYYTPKGRCIQAQGIEPDVNVKFVVPTTNATPPLREKDITGHIEAQNGTEKLAENTNGTEKPLVNNGSSEVAPGNGTEKLSQGFNGTDKLPDAETILQNDNQLRTAVDILRSRSVFREWR